MTTLPDFATTLFLLPLDARLLSLEELAPALRKRLGPLDRDEVVVTRPGFRVIARQIPGPLSDLLSEFRTASRITDAIYRFSRAHGQDPKVMLDLSFDALLACIAGRILVDATSPDAHAAAPSLASGQAFAGMEIETLVRALEDTEVYRIRYADGREAALKIARDERAAAMLTHEAGLLAELNGIDVPVLLGHGKEGNRVWLALDWRKAVPISVAAQQARSGGDHSRLAAMIRDMLASYARLHARGIVHGDIHTGNILVEDDGRITLIDFGRACRTDAIVSDPKRAGIPFFHDPELAAAQLLGAPPPAASTVAEQYALATLAYFLLTGLHAIQPSIDQGELLARIVTRPPLPFTARGATAWTRVEAVLRRALAKEPAQRFPTTLAFARAFDRASRSTPRPAVRRKALEPALAALRNGEGFAGMNARAQAWLSLRAAIARSDETLLAAADIAVARADDSWESKAVAAAIAHARSDRVEEQGALEGFLSAALRLRRPAFRCRALLAAAEILQGAAAHGLKVQPLCRWAEDTVLDLWPKANPHVLHAAMALDHVGAVRLPPDARDRLQMLRTGSVWLWSLAHDLFADSASAARAAQSPCPAEPLAAGLRALRLYQLSSAETWVLSARRAAAELLRQRNIFAATLLAIELEGPSRVVPPPWRLLPQEDGRPSR
jgi:predicted Ser/Thr protein kinase